MNLSKKKALAAKTLKVGKNRIVFLKSGLNEIKEAITKQDIRDLQKARAIIIKEIKGKKKRKRKRKKRSQGNIRKKVSKRKREYVTITRKLRKYIDEMKKQGKLSKDEIKDIRKKIKSRMFRDKSHLNEYIEELKK